MQLITRVENELTYQHKSLILSLGLAVSFLIAYLTSTIGLLAPILTVVIGAAIVFFIVVLKNPIIGLFSTLIYCFTYILVEREVEGQIPFGYIVEVLYFIVLGAAIIKEGRNTWSRLKNDLVLLFTLWFIISILQILNPAEPSFDGWLSEIRSSGFDSFVIVIIGFLTFRKVKHLNHFITIILVFSLLAALNGARQLFFGLLPGEQGFLNSSPFHMIWGQLRVFSFYRDAGQFGASQAAFTVVCGVLTFGPFKFWKRAIFLLLTLVFFYGMLISGTRGALFALVSGAFLGTFLFKNIKVLLSGLLFLLMFVSLLKFTYIGSGFSYVHRLRSALDTSDPSLNLRLFNQAVLRDYIQDYPFGSGLGVMGYAGWKYNPEKFISAIAPDSYWVKVWGMYGIVGLTFWFCMMMYIFGKCCGIIWNIKSESLRVKLIALTAGAFGIFICSYGNEVINTLPSSITVYLSFVLVFLGPQFDQDIQKNLI